MVNALERQWVRFLGQIIGTLLMIGLTAAPAIAAQLAGTYLPDTREVAGKLLVLNGIALRTYSVMRINIYVAGLYLENRTISAETVLDSPQMKLLEIHFLHDVGQAAVHEAWRTGFADNCTAPCHLDPKKITRFIAAAPAVHAGDISMFLFTRQGLTVSVRGQSIGTITDQHFAREVLDTFLGPVPPTPRVKRELLGGR